MNESVSIRCNSTVFTFSFLFSNWKLQVSRDASSMRLCCPSIDQCKMEGLVAHLPWHLAGSNMRLGFVIYHYPPRLNTRLRIVHDEKGFVTLFCFWPGVRFCFVLVFTNRSLQLGTKFLKGISGARPSKVEYVQEFRPLLLSCLGFLANPNPNTDRSVRSMAHTTNMRLLGLHVVSVVQVIKNLLIGNQWWPRRCTSVAISTNLISQANQDPVAKPGPVFPAVYGEYRDILLSLRAWNPFQW